MRTTNDRKVCRVIIRVNEGDREWLEYKSREKNETISEYLREIIRREKAAEGE